VKYVASVALVPHSNQALVATPFGLTVPFAVPEETVTEVAAVVTTVGLADAVLKVQGAPVEVVVPDPFFATTFQ
jgi:hypothetical protein